MDLKLETARAAVKLITDQKRVGLGEGSTIAFLVSELKNQPLLSDRIFYSSSEKTKQLLGNAGFETGSLDQISSIDIYFDGCDQLDQSLNALKSGAGIHTMEKLLATMASEFVLLGDESKFVKQFDGKFPLVIESIPEAFSFLQAAVSRLAPGTKLIRRETNGAVLLTSHGNQLTDCWLTERSDLMPIAAAVKQLPGVLDTSLFTGICKKAVIAGTGGTKIVLPVRG